MDGLANIVATALQRGEAQDFEALANVCKDNVEFTSAVTRPATGPADVVAELQRLQVAGRFAKAEAWETVDLPAGARVVARLPLNAFYERFEWQITGGPDGKIERIVQTGVAQTTPLPPSAVCLSDEFVQAFDIARETRNPVIVAYVDSGGRPRQSPRGTAQVLSETQLAFWNHNPNGELIRSIAANPNLSLHYWGGIGTSFGGAVSFLGRASVQPDRQTRDLIYGRSPASEQRSDPEQAGCAVVIEVVSVSGFMAGTRYNMQAEHEAASRE